MKYLAMLITFALLLTACGGGGETVEVEVTREVSKEITVEVTRETTVEIPVTVEVTREVEKIVEVTVIVEVTPTPIPPTPTPFITIEDVEPKDALASEFVEGNASIELPAGEIGEVSVIVVSSPSGGYGSTTLPIIIRNNTPDVIRRAEISAVAYDSGRNIIAVGGDQGFDPNVISPGEISIGYIYFSDAELPKDTTFEFESNYKIGEKGSFESIRDLKIIEFSKIENRIVGFLQNQYDGQVTGPISVEVHCFNEAGTYLRSYNDYTDKDEAAPGDKIPFQVGTRDACPQFWITASGFD